MRVFGMKTAAAKAKGRRLQQWFRDKLIETLEVPEDDVRSTAMGQSGEDILMSYQARQKFPFSVECKNQERLSIWDALTQAEDNSGKHVPLLIFKKNRSKTYAVLEFEELLKLLDGKDS